MPRFLSCMHLASTLFSLLLVGASAQTGTFKILHNFTGGTDGAYPSTPLTLDKAGNLYGMAGGGGTGAGCPEFGCGTAFELSQRNNRWGLMPLVEFSSSNGEGPGPNGSMVVGGQGTIYWTAGEGGAPSCECGAVLELAKSGGVWTQTTLHAFLGGIIDGQSPDSGLVQDRLGNLYGTTQSGGSGNSGTAFELTPNAGDSWTYNVIYNFTSQGDGGFPSGQIAVDANGNIYGTTAAGGLIGEGTAYKLSPSAGGWTLTTLYNFASDFGNNPQQEGVALDGAGNLYGITRSDGEYDLGTVYELTPTVGFWNLTTLHTFTGNNDGADPFGPLTIDQAGAVYGATYFGGIHAQGTVYKLVKGKSQWNIHTLHSFGGADGEESTSGVILDSSGNLYGATNAGGTYGFGVAFEITQ